MLQQEALLPPDNVRRSQLERSTKRPCWKSSEAAHEPAEMASPLNLLLAGHRMLEELLDLVAVGGRAGWVVTGRGMHQ